MYAKKPSNRIPIRHWMRPCPKEVPWRPQRGTQGTLKDTQGTQKVTQGTPNDPPRIPKRTPKGPSEHSWGHTDTQKDSQGSLRAPWGTHEPTVREHKASRGTQGPSQRTLHKSQETQETIQKYLRLGPQYLIMFSCTMRSGGGALALTLSFCFQMSQHRLYVRGIMLHELTLQQSERRIRLAGLHLRKALTHYKGNRTTLEPRGF